MINFPIINPAILIRELIALTLPSPIGTGEG